MPKTPSNNAQRILRGRLGMKKRGSGGALERRIIAHAAIETIQFVEDEAEAAHTANGLMIKDPDEMSISELALDNTLFASRNINLFLRTGYETQQQAIKDGEAVDLKLARLLMETSNATIRSLARVHEAYLAGAKVDRLGQILEEIKRLEGET